MKRISSPYNAAIAGGGFLLEETIALLPLLQSDNRQERIEDEKIHNRVMMVNTQKSRYNFIREITRRYDSLPTDFWNDVMQMSHEEQIVANFFVILKTYKLLFDFHVNVTMRRWRSGSRTVTREDIMMEFDEIASHDEFVDSWSENTKRKVSSAYLTILRKVGMLGNDDNLSAIKSCNLDYYLVHGEPWFLEACLLAPYEIENIKKTLL